MGFWQHLSSDRKDTVESKAVYFCLCLQETQNIMTEGQEGREPLSDLFERAFFLQ